MSLTVGSLFSGIGGIDLGLERAGMRVVWQSEIDLYACRVLAKHWPDVPNLGDITTIDWKEVPRVDLICGGYPCQPFSLAGARAGADDPRHLWPHMLTAIRELRPRWALLENVPGHLSLGFGRVLGDLAEVGYDAEWSLVSACSVGAPHTRERLFCVAYPARQGLEEWGGPPSPRPWVQSEPQRPHRQHLWQVDGVEPGLRGRAHGVPHRVDRLRALGNAVVPQVAEHIGRLIVEAAA